MNNLIGIESLTKDQIFDIIECAEDIEFNPKKYLNKLQDKSLAIVFFQSSTRTMLSTSLAMQKLGGKVIVLDKLKFTSEMEEQESFNDTIKVVGDYVDLVCLRDKSRESPFICEKITSAKILNCGNGYDQHPSQTLIDLYTIFKEFQKLNNLKISIVGGLKNSRSAHSLLIALSMFENNSIKLISPIDQKMPAEYLALSRCGKISESDIFEIEDEDIIYMAGLTAFDANQDTIKKYCLTSSKLKSANSKAIILNPLPRINEIEKEVDNFSNAKYFDQSKNGIFIRMALFLKLLDVK